MQEIAELERRITAALERIGRGVDQSRASGAEAREVAALKQALEEERTVNAQLQERLRALKDRASPVQNGAAAADHAGDARIDLLTSQIDQQGLELQRLRQTTAQLREQLRTLREAAVSQAVNPQLINRAMMAELDALRADRLADIAELDEILSELTPLIAEVQTDARA